MKRPAIRLFLHYISALPLSWLSFPWNKRILLVAASYGLGIVGLWFFFPRVQNGITMILPIGCSCWLFRYRGLLISMLLVGVVFQLGYLFFWHGLLPDRDFVEGGIIGFSTFLMLGCIVCWLRTAVDLIYTSRRQALLAEQARLLAIFRERQARLAYDQQYEINRMKDQFLLNVSHELRTPLTIVEGYLELLDVQNEMLGPVERLSILKEALRGTEELRNLVDQILDATKIINDVPLAKSAPINIAHFLQEIQAHLAPLHAQNYTFTLHAPAHIIAWADPQFLHQIFTNLFSNIFKYVPSQTEIRIEATQDDPSSNVYLSVQDAGPGIPAEELPLLFEKFARLKRDLASSTQGLGLGLYICKRLVEAMGGQIWAESPACGTIGTRFSIALPPHSSTDLVAAGS